MDGEPDWRAVTQRLAEQLVGGANPGILRRGVNKLSREQSSVSDADVNNATAQFLSTVSDKAAFISTYKQLKATGSPHLAKAVYLLHRIKSDPAVFQAATRASPPVAEASPAPKRGREDYSQDPNPFATPQPASRTPAPPSDADASYLGLSPIPLPGATPEPTPGRPTSEDPDTAPGASNPLFNQPLVPSPNRSRFDYSTTLLKSLAVSASQVGQVHPSVGPSGQLFHPHAERSAAGALPGAPPLPGWNYERAYLTGDFLLEAAQDDPGNPRAGPAVPLSSYSPSAQEMAVVDDLLYAFLGMDGQFVRAAHFTTPTGDTALAFTCAVAMEPSLQEVVSRMLPLPEYVVVIQRFTERRAALECGTVCHALVAACNCVLSDWALVVAQLEHQMHLGQLSLQALWFHCQQPLGNLRELAAIAAEVCERDLTASGILNLLQHRATGLAGDAANSRLVTKLLQAAAEPYCRMVEAWLCEGCVDDVHSECMVQVDADIQIHTEDRGSDNSPYWFKKYQVRQALASRVLAPAPVDDGVDTGLGRLVDDVPAFLAASKTTILTTGKYLNTLRECGQPLTRPLPPGTRLALDAAHSHTATIATAFRGASQQLLDYFMSPDRFSLMSWLESLKHTFLLDRADFMAFFLDIAGDELVKKGSEISHTRMQSLLEMALKSSLAGGDPHHEAVTFKVDVRDALALRKAALPARSASRQAAAAQEYDQTRLERVSGWGLFSMQFLVRWPLSIVVPYRQREQYQLVFKSLFILQYSERMLKEAWAWLAAPLKWPSHDRTYPQDLDHPNVQLALSTTSVMLHFVRQFFQYLTFEVIQPAWHIMERDVQGCDSLDGIIEAHRKFLLKLMKGCLLDERHYLYHMTQLQSTVVSFCQLMKTTFSPVGAAASHGAGDDWDDGTPRAAGPGSAESKARRQVMEQLHDRTPVRFEREMDGLFAGLLTDATRKGHVKSTVKTFGNLCIAFRRRFEVRLGQMINGTLVDTEGQAPQRLRGLRDVYKDALTKSQSAERHGARLKDASAVDPRDLIDNLKYLIDRLQALERLTVQTFL